MDPIVTAAILAAAAAILASWFTYLSTRKTSDTARIKSLEERFDALTARHRLLWRFCQTLIVHINTGQPGPAPDWPPELNDID